MKIAFIPSTFLPIIGGAEIQTHNLGNKIAEEHKVDIFLLKDALIKKKKYKIKIYDIDYDETIIENINERVEACKEYIKTLLEKIN